MVVDTKQFERDRIVNMLKSFGWEMVSTSTEGDVVKITFQKTIKAEVPK